MKIAAIKKKSEYLYKLKLKNLWKAYFFGS